VKKITMGLKISGGAREWGLRRGCPLPRMGVRGYQPREIFKI